MNGLEVRHQTSTVGDKVTPFSVNISTLVTFRGHMVSGEASALLKEMVRQMCFLILCIEITTLTIPKKK